MLITELMNLEKRASKPGEYVVLALLSTLFLAVIFPVLVPVLMGLLISMVFQPIYQWIAKVCRQRTHLAAGISTLLLIIGVVLPLTLITIFVLQNTVILVTSVSDSLQNQSPGELKILEIPVVAKIYAKVNSLIHLSKDEFTDRLKEITVIVVSFLTKLIGGLAASVPGKLLSGGFFLISFYFGLIDGTALREFVRASLPFAGHEMDDFFETVYSISRGVVLGTLAGGIAQGIIIGLGYWIFGIPKPFFFGSITVIFSFVPIIGSLPTGLGGVIYLLIGHHYGAAIGMGVAYFLAWVADHVLKPWILKGHAELHPLIGLISVLGGLHLFGFSGLFFGPLIAALTIALIQLTLQEPQGQEGSKA